MNTYLNYVILRRMLTEQFLCLLDTVTVDMIAFHMENLQK